MKPADVIIVGGGWAGISAAVHAAERGIRVILLESAPQLGGRCFSFYDKRFGVWLDNGVHVFVGAYRETMSLLKRWGMDSAVDFNAARSIYWLEEAGWEACLRTGSNALCSAWGLLQFRALSFRERIATARCAFKMGRTNPAELHDLTAAEYLQRQGIDPRGAGGLWEAICLAALNAPPERADVKPLIAAVREGLLIGGKTGRLGIMTLPFRQLLSEPALGFLEDTGVEVRLRVRVDSLRIGRRGGVEGVSAGGENFTAGSVILALPPKTVFRLVKPLERDAPWVAALNQWEYSAITSVHLLFDRPVLSRLPMFLRDGYSQWLFGRGEREKDGWRRISTVISSAEKGNPRDIAVQTITELRRRFPELAGMPVEVVKVVQNQRATVLLTPGSAVNRPEPVTAIPGLYLAGDWCASDLPATIESAARSGRHAVEAISTG